VDAGGFVPAGDGGGTFSGTTLRVGSGNGGALRLLFALVFVFALLLAFAFTFASGLTSSIGVGSCTAFAFGEAFTLADALIEPPDGSPCSALPVGGGVGCTG
jgi:hypothetical protein